jgi:diacylglycerol kinase (ATP)
MVDRALKSTSALSVLRIFRALNYSRQGVVSAWKEEAAFRQEIVAFAVLLPLTLWLRLPRLDTLFLVALMALVLALELFNSGLEALVDKTCPEHNVLAGRAKDCGSAAVLLGWLTFSVSWLVLAGPSLLGRWSGT